MPKSDTYLPVPVAAAKAIAESFKKNIIVIVANDPVANMTHFTSYGVSAQDKQHAASGAEACARVLGCDLKKSTTFEDFRPLVALRQWRDTDFRDALTDEKAIDAALAMMKLSLEKGMGSKLAFSMAIGDFVCNAMDSTDINPQFTGRK